MGYYSKVAICMRREDAIKMTEELNKTLNDSSILDEEWEVELLKYGDYVVFKWDEIKWYTGSYGYDDVNFVMDYLNTKMDNETQPYYFVRIGEDYGDIEEFCNKAEAETLYIHNNIMCPYWGINFYGEGIGIVRGKE